MNFKFDYIFGSSSTNDIIYSEIGQSLFDSVYNGYNTSILFNGEQMNLWNNGECIASHFIINMVSKLLSIIQQNDDQNIKYTLSVTYIATFLERIFDLFHPEKYGDDDIGEVTNVGPSFINNVTKRNIDKDCSKSAMKNTLIKSVMKFEDYIDDPTKCHTLFVIHLNQYNFKTRVTLKGKIKIWKIKKYQKIQKVIRIGHGK